MMNPKHRQASETWRRMLKNHNDMEKKVLELLRHPDAKPEDIKMLRETYINSYQTMLKAEDRIRNKFGNYSTPYFPTFR
jgi:hypothetical protein